MIPALILTAYLVFLLVVLLATEARAALRRPYGRSDT